MEQAGDERGDVGRLARGGSANALAAVVATVAGLVIVVLAGRSMTPAQYATFASIWGLVFGGASVVAALEPEVARHHANAPGPIDKAELSTMLIVSAAAVVVMGTLLAVFADELRVESTFIFGCVVVTSAVFPSMFLARGYLAGSLRFVSLAWVTASEALVRLAVVAGGLLAGLAAVPTFAVAALASAMVGLPVLARRSAWRQGPVSLPASLQRTAVLMGGNVAAALLITGAPVLVSLAMVGSSATSIGLMQSAVVVSRFPLMALMLIQSLLVPVFARRRSLESRQDYRVVLGGLVLAMPVAAVAAYLLGPLALSIIYGPEYVVEPSTMALLTLGATALGGMQVLIALAVAADRHLLALIALPLALAVTAAVAFGAPWSDEIVVPVALAIGPLTGFVAAVGVTFSWGRRAWATSPAR